jgi:hypothetical protein
MAKLTVGSTPFKAKPAGVYRFKMLDATIKDSQNPTFGPYLLWSLQIIEDVDGGGALDGENHTHITPASIGPKSKYWGYLCAMAPEFESVGEDDLFELDTDELKGREFYAQVEVEVKKDGSERNVFKEVWSVKAYTQHLNKMEQTLKSHKERKSLSDIAKPVEKPQATPEKEAVANASASASESEAPPIARRSVSTLRRGGVATPKAQDADDLRLDDNNTV